MMSAAHTPGPWVPKWSKYREGEFIVQTEHASKRILATFDGDGDGPDDQSIADARLIAAAPALLLELEMTVDLLERASRTLTEECKSALDGRQWGGVRIASARAAISLAKGEAK